MHNYADLDFVSHFLNSGSSRWSKEAVVSEVKVVLR